MGIHLKSAEYYTLIHGDIIDKQYVLPFILVCLACCYMYNSMSSIMLLKIRRSKTFDFVYKPMLYVSSFLFYMMIIWFSFCILSVCDIWFTLLCAIIVVILIKHSVNQVSCMIVILLLGEFGVRFCISKIGDIVWKNGVWQITFYQHLWGYDVLSSGDMIFTISENAIQDVFRDGKLLNQNQYSVKYYRPIFSN